jgi:starch synthase (maltosyl-transferring)
MVAAMIGRSVGRIVVTDVEPAVGCGQWPAKAVVGETFPVSATVFRDGHDAVGATVVLTGPDGRGAPFTRMHPSGVGTDRFEAEVRADTAGLWGFRVEAWGDPWATWRHAVEVKAAAGQSVEELAVDFEDGARLLERAGRELPPQRGQLLRAAVGALRDDDVHDPHERLRPALEPELDALIAANPLRDLVTRSPLYRVWVDRPRALFGSWYEFFPRSEGASLDPPRSGTLKDAAGRLPAIAEMGFDVVYLPPVHPIGEVNRKGPNNTLRPGPEEPGSPWAIGSRCGGHDAIHPDLGTFDDFDDFVGEARRLGMEVALDLALQCAPDHPWAKEHPEWFTVKSDGSIAFAENPPKKYQDIYPLNFDKDPEGIYAEVLRIVRVWTSHGVRIFRVDNPHTKPIEFWEWLIAEVKSTEPDVLFLAEAFTRPAMMHMLAKVGFTQSYTYFTWRNSKQELEEYGRELVAAAHYMRPNFFVNTPDILHEYLQHGGEPAFKIRAVVAAMMSPTWGVYSGYELYERTPVRPGSEEYLDSEKYQYRPRDWVAAELDGRSLAPYLATLNRVRRDHPALQRLRNLCFHYVDTPEVMAFSKRLDEDRVLVVVNLDPHNTHEATVHLDMAALGLEWWETVDVHDEVTGAEYTWGARNYVRLDPWAEPAHVFTLVRRS